MKEDPNYCNTCPQEIRGLCCYSKRIINKETGMITYSDPCIYLNKAHRCKIYKKRFKINPYCLDLGKAIKLMALPPGCKYLDVNEKKAII